MTHIGLSRAKHLILVSKFLERTGTAVEPLAERVKLPVECLSRPEMLVPTHCIREFREVAARSLGMPNIVLDAIRNLDFKQLGQFGHAISQTRCLYDSLVEFCALANNESSSVVVTLNRGEDCVWLSHRPLEKQANQWNSELYILNLMLWTVRLSAPGWSPEVVQVCFAATPDRRAALVSLGCKCATFGAQQTSFSVPRSMLALPLHVEQQQTQVAPADRPQIIDAAPAITFAESLAQALRAYRLQPWTRIEIVAEISGLSMRTLQRRFSDEGLSFSLFVEKSRFDHAISLLTNTEAKMSDIAAELGYSTQANFTRAFQRWSGVTPSEFRRQRTAS